MKQRPPSSNGKGKIKENHAVHDVEDKGEISGKIRFSKQHKSHVQQ